MDRIKEQVASARQELGAKRQAVMAQIAGLQEELRGLERQVAMLDAIEHPERLARPSAGGRGGRSGAPRRTGVSDSVLAALAERPQTLKQLRQVVGGGASLGSTLSHLKKSGRIVQDDGQGRNRAYRLP